MLLSTPACKGDTPLNPLFAFRLIVFQKTINISWKRKPKADPPNQPLKEKDYTTHNFLQWYVSEQIEEEALARQIVDKLKLIGDDKGGLYFFDRDLEAMAIASENEKQSMRRGKIPDNLCLPDLLLFIEGADRHRVGRPAGLPVVELGHGPDEALPALREHFGLVHDEALVAHVGDQIRIGRIHDGDAL